MEHPQPGRSDQSQRMVENETLYGEGVVNDKGPMAAFLMAAKAVKAAGLPLRGDLLLSAVPGAERSRR